MKALPVSGRFMLNFSHEEITFCITVVAPDSRLLRARDKQNAQRRPDKGGVRRARQGRGIDLLIRRIQSGDHHPDLSKHRRVWHEHLDQQASVGNQRR